MSDSSVGVALQTPSSSTRRRVHAVGVDARDVRREVRRELLDVGRVREPILDAEHGAEADDHRRAERHHDDAEDHDGRDDLDQRVALLACAIRREQRVGSGSRIMLDPNGTSSTRVTLDDRSRSRCRSTSGSLSGPVTLSVSSWSPQVGRRARVGPDRLVARVVAGEVADLRDRRVVVVVRRRSACTPGRSPGHRPSCTGRTGRCRWDCRLLQRLRERSQHGVGVRALRVVVSDAQRGPDPAEDRDHRDARGSPP